MRSLEDPDRGQYHALVVQTETPDGEPRDRIVVGNHTYEAMVRLGWTDALTMPRVMDDDAALRLLLDDNHSSDVASYDDPALAALLVSVREAGQLDRTLFEDAAVDALLEATAQPEPPAEFPSADDVEVDYKCPSCGYGWSGSTT